MGQGLLCGWRSPTTVGREHRGESCARRLNHTHPTTRRSSADYHRRLRTIHHLAQRKAKAATRPPPVTLTKRRKSGEERSGQWEKKEKNRWITGFERCSSRTRQRGCTTTKPHESSIKNNGPKFDRFQ
jgi:hypothetical protein